MINWVKKYYEKNSIILNVISILIGFIGTIFGIYSYVSPIDSSPKLTIVEISEVYLFVNNKGIKDLKVLYQDKDLNKEETNLIVKTIKIINLGKSPIRIDDYANDGIKLKFRNCKLISAHAERLKNNPISNELNPQIDDTTTLVLNKVVFNPKEEITFNVYVLHNSKSKPIDFQTIGRIAGQDNIIKTTAKQLKGETTIFEDILSFIIAMLPISALIFGGIILNYLYSLIRNWLRKRRILNKFNYKIKELTLAQNTFVDIYEILGETKFINLLKGLLIGQEYINKEENVIKAIETVNSIETKGGSYNYSEYYLAESKLKNNNLLVKNDINEYKITEEFELEILNTLNLFKN